MKRGHLTGRWLAAALAAAVFSAASLSGCAGEEKGADTGNGASGEKEITVAVNSETGTLDPAGSIALTYLSYSVTALDELLTYDENGEIEYRAAESYEVNEDSTVWTFHLRENALWSDGTPVTAEDFLNTIRRALDPASGSGYAVYLFPIENAEEIYDQEASVDTLGVDTPDDHTLVFRLEEPCVYFLDLLRLPVYTPSCAKYADSVDSGWDKDPETSLANGPFMLAEYVPDQYFVLEKNEFYWNQDAVRLDRIIYRFFDDTQAMAAAYETGEVDVAVSLPSSVMELYEGRDDLLVTEQIATRYIYFNLDVEPFDDVRVREAFNLAIDREELCRILGEDTEPTYNLVAKYMIDKNTGMRFVDEAEQPFGENAERARELLAEAGYPDGEGFPEITYSYPTLEMDSDTAQVIREQLKKNLNIDIELKAQELQANYSSRHAGDFDLCRMNWTADFADPYTYLSMLLSNSTYNCSGIHDEEYDAIVEASGSEQDPAARSVLLHQAEQRAVGEQFYIIPLYAMKSV
ncbi:MAG TPA: peptide ABC transporter substrate-binding protein, partial [Candidatus Mediterraneibacter caccavium]|nr:peptide ABC transporter substrate-binding protein [Candidatus Mediterraneibacter caccavium]